MSNSAKPFLMCKDVSLNSAFEASDIHIAIPNGIKTNMANMTSGKGVMKGAAEKTTMRPRSNKATTAIMIHQKIDVFPLYSVNCDPFFPVFQCCFEFNVYRYWDLRSS